MLFPFIGITAQDSKTITRPAQITLISPLGTNGLQSPHVTNVISLNLFAGVAGGVKGVEVGGFANAINGDVKGVQIAGFFNGVKGKTTGAQITGFINLNKGITNGSQIAGFTNIVTSDVNAVQVSGFTNIATKNVKGAQIAGFMNFSKEEVDGLQLGVFNYAKNVKGAQIGVFNYAENIEKGVAIGVLSIVKNGYKAIELKSTETIHGIVSFKTGTNKFFNILSVGGNFDGSNSWSVGYGIGTLMHFTKRMDISFEAHSFHINEDESWTRELNMLNKLSATLSYNISDRYSVFGGASWNVAVSQLKDSEGNVVGSSHIPWFSYNETHNGVNVKQYAGFNFGLRMKL